MSLSRNLAEIILLRVFALSLAVNCPGARPRSRLLGIIALLSVLDGTVFA